MGAAKLHRLKVKLEVLHRLNLTACYTVVNLFSDIVVHTSPNE
jgi:hypothetical protein